jgi:hypothetical protein
MQHKPTAADFLSDGDSLRAHVEREGCTVACAAAAAGLPLGTAYKAHWLVGVLDLKLRRKLGPAVLGALSPMHLEVVARCDRATQEHLLRSAAAGGMTARELKKLAGTSERGSSGGTVDALRRSTSAMEHYAQFDDRSLKTLLNGPNGAEVRQVASAGRQLANRLATVSD